MEQGSKLDCPFKDDLYARFYNCIGSEPFNNYYGCSMFAVACVCISAYSKRFQMTGKEILEKVALDYRTDIENICNLSALQLIYCNRMLTVEQKIEFMKFLIERFNINVNVKVYINFTGGVKRETELLSWFCSMPEMRVEFIELLLQHGADVTKVTIYSQISSEIANVLIFAGYVPDLTKTNDIVKDYIRHLQGKITYWKDKYEREFEPGGKGAIAAAERFEQSAKRQKCDETDAIGEPLNM